VIRKFSLTGWEKHRASSDTKLNDDYAKEKMAIIFPV
jgi:hypothetical protein